MGNTHTKKYTPNKQCVAFPAGYGSSKFVALLQLAVLAIISLLTWAEMLPESVITDDQRQHHNMVVAASQGLLIMISFAICTWWETLHLDYSGKVYTIFSKRR